MFYRCVCHRAGKSESHPGALVCCAKENAAWRNNSHDNGFDFLASASVEMQQ